jgi:diguanylate cyclase (GGDEF)-like protein
MTLTTLKQRPSPADNSPVPADGDEANRPREIGGTMGEATKSAHYGSVDGLELIHADPSTHRVPSSTRPRRLTAAIIALSATLALATVILLVRGPLVGLEPVRLLIPQPAMFFLVCVLWAAALWEPISLHHRGNTYLYALEEVPLVLGLVFLSPSLLVIACVCTNALVFLVFRRQDLVKAFFNLAMAGLSAAVAAVTFRELLGTDSPLSFRGSTSAAVALCAAATTMTVLVEAYHKLNGQTAQRRTGPQIAIKLVLIAASVCLALAFLDAAWFDLWATVPLVLVAVLIVVTYQAYTRLSLRFASLQRLYDFSRALGTANLEPSSMSLEVLSQVCTVMRARRAQLILAEPSGLPRKISLDDRGPSGIELIGLDKSSIVTQAIETSVASLHNTATPQRRSSYDPISGRYVQAMVAPLMNENASIGAIVALDRDEELDDFDDDDLRLFEALVAHASANLERARLVEELRFEVDSKSHQATHDMLTGLPNRMLFLSRATSALNDSGGVAIVLLDLDRFKDVNDTLGHAIGDRLLCEVAERLLRAVGEQVTVARLGGDEFALVIADVTEAERAVAIVNELNAELSRPIEMDGLTLAVTASAGVALAPEHGDDVPLLLQRADIAMYLAKERRSTIEVYSVEHDQSMRRWLMLGGLLTHALQTGTELSVMYQPIADVRSRNVVQVEALARWNHPAHGAIPPEEFIGIAEQMGLINQISEFVLSEACAQLSRWRHAGIDIGLAINVSGREFADGSLVDRVARHLRDHDLPPNILTLEVTETEIMADLAQATLVLDQLADLGIRIGIDDYGTGYSSLAYLHRLPVQELKIDRSFVTNLPNEMSNRIIVRSSIAMAHSLGLTVVAEGAEDEVTCAMLADAGCDQIQGYYLSRPKGPVEFQEWILQGASLEFAPLQPALISPDDEYQMLSRWEPDRVIL